MNNVNVEAIVKQVLENMLEKQGVILPELNDETLVQYFKEICRS